MGELTAIPGSIGAAAKRIRWHRRADTVTPNASGPCRVYEADVPDGLLRALVSHDEAGTGGRLLWHLSVSFRDKSGSPSRLPTWDELKRAKYELMSEDVPMLLIFPRKAAPYVNIHETCLHLWESETEID